MSPCTITPATAAEVPVLLRLIQELAEFEQLGHEVEVSDRTLSEALFGERPVASALLARIGEVVVGYAVYYRTFSTFVGRPGLFLDDLYVRPSYRERGIGRALLEAVAKVGMDGGGRLEWITLRWNERALRFYRGLGARVMEDWALLRMNGAGVRGLIRS
jgi:GNAT superfamily N-acetyltransferase